MTLLVALLSAGAAINAVAIRSSSVSIGFNCLSIFETTSFDFSFSTFSVEADFDLSDVLQEISNPPKINAESSFFMSSGFMC